MIYRHPKENLTKFIYFKRFNVKIIDFDILNPTKSFLNNFIFLGEVEKNVSGPLISENAFACARNPFLVGIFHQLTNIDLVLKDKICEKCETEVH